MRTRILSCLAVLALAPEAMAAEFFDCNGTPVAWSGDWTNLEIVDHTSGPEFNAILTAAIKWKDSAMDFQYTFTTGAVARVNGDGVNQIEVTAPDGVGSGGQAQLFWNGNCNFTEADIFIDGDGAFTYNKLDRWGYGGPSRPYEGTILHEMGHAFGLAHEADVYNIMGQEWNVTATNGSSAQGQPGADGIAGGVFLYGGVTDREDVSVAHWRRTGDDGTYSSHGRTRILNTSGVELPVAWIDGEPVYAVRAGDQVRVELTFENNGFYGQWVDIDYHLSTNDYISSGDPFRGYSSTYLSAGEVDTRQMTLTIPSSEAPGRRWFGAIIDAPNDVYSHNDASYVGIDIMPPGDWDYCGPNQPCDRGEGDCDTNADCASGLSCIQNNGAYWGFAADIDVCDLPFGDATYCTPEFPCPEGYGDCDVTNDCELGASCVQDNGLSFGYPAWVDACEVISGGYDDCTAAAPCTHGQGDCDSDSHCTGGTTCVHNVGADYGWNADVDVCELPAGDFNFCTPTRPCWHGEGDCDTDADCRTGLTCVMDVGPSYGFGVTVDVCEDLSGGPG